MLQAVTKPRPARSTHPSVGCTAGLRTLAAQLVRLLGQGAEPLPPPSYRCPPQNAPPAACPTGNVADAVDTNAGAADAGPSDSGDADDASCGSLHSPLQLAAGGVEAQVQALDHYGGLSLAGRSLGVARRVLLMAPQEMTYSPQEGVEHHRYYFKINYGEVADLAPNYQESLRSALARAGCNVLAMDVAARSGCIELVVDVTLQQRQGEAQQQQAQELLEPEQQLAAAGMEELGPAQGQSQVPHQLLEEQSPAPSSLAEQQPQASMPGAGGPDVPPPALPERRPQGQKLSGASQDTLPAREGAAWARDLPSPGPMLFRQRLRPRPGADADHNDAASPRTGGQSRAAAAGDAPTLAAPSASARSFPCPVVARRQLPGAQPRGAVQDIPAAQDLGRALVRQERVLPLLQALRLPAVQGARVTVAIDDHHLHISADEHGSWQLVAPPPGGDDDGGAGDDAPPSPPHAPPAVAAAAAASAASGLPASLGLRQPSVAAPSILAVQPCVVVLPGEAASPAASAPVTITLELTVDFGLGFGSGRAGGAAVDPDLVCWDDPHSGLELLALQPGQFARMLRVERLRQEEALVLAPRLPGSAQHVVLLRATLQLAARRPCSIVLQMRRGTQLGAARRVLLLAPGAESDAIALELKAQFPSMANPDPLWRDLGAWFSFADHWTEVQRQRSGTAESFGADAAGAGAAAAAATAAPLGGSAPAFSTSSLQAHMRGVRWALAAFAADHGLVALLRAVLRPGMCAAGQQAAGMDPLADVLTSRAAQHSAGSSAGGRDRSTRLPVLHRAVRSGNWAVVMAAAGPPPLEAVQYGRRCVRTLTRALAGVAPATQLIASSGISSSIWQGTTSDGLSALHMAAVLDDGGAVASHILANYPEARAAWNRPTVGGQVACPAAAAAHFGNVVDIEVAVLQAGSWCTLLAVSLSRFGDPSLERRYQHEAAASHYVAALTLALAQALYLCIFPARLVSFGGPAEALAVAALLASASAYTLLLLLALLAWPRLARMCTALAARRGARAAAQGGASCRDWYLGRRGAVYLLVVSSRLAAKVAALIVAPRGVRVAHIGMLLPYALLETLLQLPCHQVPLRRALLLLLLEAPLTAAHARRQGLWEAAWLPALEFAGARLALSCVLCCALEVLARHRFLRTHMHAAKVA